MEFFLPSLIILVLAGIVSFVIIPKTSPLVILILSLCLLMFGMYHHYKLFASEYRLSTWQEQFKFYGPGVAIGGLILFILLFVLSIFRGGQVPVPEVAALTPAPPSTEGAVGSILNTVTNATSDILNTATSVVNNMKNTVTGITGNVNRPRNTIRTSFFNKV
jgi:hypothetical protein